MKKSNVITVVVKKKDDRRVMVVKNEGDNPVSTFGHVTDPGNMSSFEQDGTVRVNNRPNLVFVSTLPKT